jgi:AraC-like DNA-binding protein
LNGAAEITLEERKDAAVWRWRITDGVAQPPAANDFAVASAVLFGRRYTGTDEPDLEVHFVHEEPSYAAEYGRVLNARARFGMPYNAILMPKRRLEQPLLRANRGMHAAFELQAQAMCERLRKDGGIAARVRELALAQIPHGDSSMESIARKLGMSVATLRRRLEDENTSHRQVLDSLRCELAREYLRDRQLAISEVAFLLGFSHVTAMHKAFKRWMDGMTPAEYRAQQRAEGGPPTETPRLAPAAVRTRVG